MLEMDDESLYNKKPKQSKQKQPSKSFAEPVPFSPACSDPQSTRRDGDHNKLASLFCSSFQYNSYNFTSREGEALGPEADGEEEAPLERGAVGEKGELEEVEAGGAGGEGPRFGVGCVLDREAGVEPVVTRGMIVSRGSQNATTQASSIPTHFWKPPRGRRELPVQNLRRRARSSLVRPRTTAQNHRICGGEPRE